MVSKTAAVHHELRLKVCIVLLLVGFLVWMYVASLRAPVNQDNLCILFKENPEWYWDAQASSLRWGVPINVQMAVMQKESHFRSSVKPSYHWVLGRLPFAHASSAEGYTQALDGTWHAFLRATGRKSASRDNFSDAVDFLGWYISQLHRIVQIKKTDAFKLYLAYHEGPGGYRAHSYLSKPWLIHIAREVSHRAHEYQNQLYQCRNSLPQKHWWRFW